MSAAPSEVTRRELERAVKSRELLDALTPVLAASFGVLAIRKKRGPLTVACMPGMSRKAIAALGRILATDLIARPCRATLLHEYIERAYLGGRRSVNFQTFLEADFLDRPECLSKLATEKQERLGDPLCTLPEWEVVFLDLDYRTRLDALDAPRPPKPPFVGGALDLGFRRVGEQGAVLYAPARVDEETSVFVQTYEFRDGAQFEHGIVNRAVRRLPHVIHPSEAQLVRIENDGTIELFFYDRFIRIAPGASPILRVAYHFLSYGSRYRRTLALGVRELFVADRHEVREVPLPAEWTGRDLGRWFGLD